MASVYPLRNGGAVQVRFGVLQGVGPVGPKGPKGDRGDSGPIGDQGLTGPAGSLSELLSVRTLTSPQSLTANTETLVAWGTVQRDDFGVFTSSTVITPQETGGIYQVSGFVSFDKPANNGNGIRYVKVVEDGAIDAVLDYNACEAVVLDQTALKFNATFEAKDGCTYKIFVKSGDDLAVALSGGRLAVNRIGAGPEGPAGPQGPAGPVGPQGIQGVKGDTGSASDGFATYEDLRP